MAPSQCRCFDTAVFSAPKSLKLKCTQDFYALHLGNGWIVLVLAAAVCDQVFERTGVWALMEQLRHDRRPFPRLKPNGGKACLCEGCVSCSGSPCPRSKRSLNYCYGCSPHNCEGCTFKHYSSPSGQFCDLGSQGLNAVGLGMCNHHSLSAFGLYIGDGLARRVDAYAGNDIPLLMAEARDPVLLPVAAWGIKIRCRGAGNSQVKTWAEIRNKPSSVGNQAVLLDQACSQVESIFKQMYNTMGNDDWRLSWYQKVGAEFEPQGAAAALSLMEAKVYQQ